MWSRAKVVHQSPGALVAVPVLASSVSGPGGKDQNSGGPTLGLHLPGVLTLFWFPACDPSVTTQPIALFELGQVPGEGRPLVVGTDPAYPRATDVRMLCRLNAPGPTVHHHLPDLLGADLRAVRN